MKMWEQVENNIDGGKINELICTGFKECENKEYWSWMLCIEFENCAKKKAETKSRIWTIEKKKYRIKQLKYYFYNSYFKTNIIT